MFLTNCYILADVIPVGEHERHQMHTLNPSQLSGSGTISDPATRLLPTYDTITTQIPLRTNNTTTQALVNDPTSPTQQVPITNVIQHNSPPEPDPLYKQKFDKPRIGGIASLADPSATSSGSTIIPMAPR